MRLFSFYPLSAATPPLPPSGEVARSADRGQKTRHIERQRNIPPNYRNTHYTVFASVPRQSLFSLSLRAAGAAIPSKN